MYLLSKDGSRHLLEFLRNLTPQVLLLSTSLVLYILWQKNPASYRYFVLFLAISALLIAAIVANANNFIDNAFRHSADIAAERDRLKISTTNYLARILQITRFIWKEKRGTLIELVITLLFLYSALFAVLIAAATTASKAME